jgi:hypothetical protein
VPSRTRRLTRTLLLLGGLLAVPRPAPTQAVLENDSLRVEIIGLRRWTVAMIQDSLARHDPKASLLSHACAVALRGIGFADASAVYYAAGTAGRRQESIVVSVVEPQDSALVRFRTAPPRRRPSTASARATAALFERHPRAAQQSLRRPATLLAGTPLAPADSVLAPALPLRGVLAAHRAPAARQRAYRTLATDGNDTNRVAAVVVLANFADADRTWWSLVDALRDPAPPVRVAAMQLLHGLAADRPRRVDWRPAAAGMRAVLDGTNLFAHNDLLEALVATEVAPRLAPRLLGGGGGRLVLGKLRSDAPRERDLARRLLVQLAGRDLGDDPDEWERWVRRL